MPRQKKFESTLYNPEWLRKVYIEEDLNASQAAALIGCTPGAILDALKKFGIPTKTMSEVIKKIPHPGSNAPRPRAQFKETLHNREWLTEHFITKEMSASEIGRIAGCSAASAWSAIVKMFDLQTTVRSTETEDVLEERRARSIAYKLFCDVQPCIVCGDPKGTRNHIDANPRNNAPENMEWLCMRHHLMVDKRLQARAARWLRVEHRAMWLEWHDEILAEVKAKPDTPTRNHYHFTIVKGVSEVKQEPE